MGKQAYEEKLAALAGLRAVSDRAKVLEALRKALRDKNNYYVSKAAALAGEMGFGELTQELVGAFDRFLAEPVKNDPQCWAKEAIVRALKEVGHRNSAVYVKGIQHVQMEPVWGREVDTADGLRGACALMLADSELDDVEVLNLLSVALADGYRQVRVEVARAMGQLGCREALPLLRFKALIGDEDAEVVGHCLAAMLEIGKGEEVSFVARFLEGKNDEMRAEAASVLAVSKEAGAFEALHRYWKQVLPEELRESLLLSLGASPQRQAAALLATIVEDGDEPMKRIAMAREALQQSRYWREFAGDA
jgi:HEAT repeat protein